MAIIILVIFGKTVNFQRFATLEPAIRFHFPKWQSESNNTSKYYALLCNHELPFLDTQVSLAPTHVSWLVSW